MEDVQCILCEVDDAEFYQEENGYRAVQCRRCGLVYTSPRPSIDEMKALYEGQETKVDLHGHLAKRDYKSIQARKCLRLIQRYQPSGRLLEVGSAAGYFLSEAKALGYDVQGLDITRQFVEFSTQVLGVPAWEGTLSQAPFADGSFDVIYMRNVLSHLAYPRREYAIVHRLLRPGGHFVFETGNVAELPADVAGELELPDHLFHFSAANIQRLLELTDFEHLATHRFMLLYKLPVLQRASQALSRRRQHPAGPRTKAAPRPLPEKLPASRLSKRIAAHLAQVFRYDVGAILPNRGRRCTLVAVARKPRE